MMDYNIRDGRTYMYFKGKPLYPFGFGLSYTTFQYSNLHLSTATLRGRATRWKPPPMSPTPAPATATKSCSCTSLHQGSHVPRPIEELKAFQRVHVPAGQTVPVTLHVKAADLAYWNEGTHGWTLEPDHVEVRLGASSADIRLHQVLSIHP